MACRSSIVLSLLSCCCLAACTPGKGGSASASESAESGGQSSTDAPTGDPTEAGALACAEHAAFADSWEAWQAAVQSEGDTYYYSVQRSGSSFDVIEYCFYRTLVVVVDGEVVERRFEISSVEGEPECEAPFVEKGAELGTHDTWLAAKPVTMDELYGACCDDGIHGQPSEDSKVTFEVDDLGLMKACFRVPNACADDCATGPFGSSLDIDQLAFGAPPPAP